MSTIYTQYNSIFGCDDKNKNNNDTAEAHEDNDDGMV